MFLSYNHPHMGYAVVESSGEDKKQYIENQEFLMIKVGTLDSFALTDCDSALDITLRGLHSFINSF